MANPFGCVTKQVAGASAIGEKQGTPSPIRQAQDRPNPPPEGEGTLRIVSKDGRGSAGGGLGAEHGDEFPAVIDGVLQWVEAPDEDC